MTRLYDRILAFGCEPLRPYHLVSRAREERQRQIAREEMEAHRPEFQTEKEMQQALAYATSRQGMASHQPIATETFDSKQLENVPVIAGDDVGAYCAGFGEGTDVAEMVSVLAPPFDSFFVEIQGAPNPLDLNAWGALIMPFGGAHGGVQETEVGWHLHIELVIEREKNKPIGPVARYLQPLDLSGRWLRHDSGEAVWAGYLPDFKPEAPPQEVVNETLDSLVPFVWPLLMTVSFMHCRNVTANELTPAEKLSRSWERKRARPLTRYHVLDIAPMREVLEREGEAGSKGLPHALHICRGHFKSFTEEAPLFGRVTGDFWWADHVRGSAEQGVIEKDYNVDLGGPQLGRPYESADEEPVIESGDEPAARDPDIAGRGLKAHAETQNLLAEAVEQAGHQPRRPRADEPNFDLAWDAGEHTVVAEIKSLTPANEERQLRLAIGQVVRYRHQLSRGGREAVAMIAVERRPSDETWLDLCNEQGIILAWPELFAAATR